MTNMKRGCLSFHIAMLVTYLLTLFLSTLKKCKDAVFLFCPKSVRLEKKLQATLVIENRNVMKY